MKIELASSETKPDHEQEIVFLLDIGTSSYLTTGEYNAERGNIYCYDAEKVGGWFISWGEHILGWASCMVEVEGKNYQTVKAKDIPCWLINGGE